MPLQLPDDGSETWQAWLELLEGGARDLTREEYARVQVPRGPSGSIQNRVRGIRIRILNARGFTVQGKRIT